MKYYLETPTIIYFEVIILRYWPGDGSFSQVSDPFEFLYYLSLGAVYSLPSLPE